MDGERTPSRVGPKQIPLDDLVAHPLNSNVMPPEYREKLVAHIRRTGRYPFLVVRAHPTEPGKYQVLDGHHRVGVLRELGHTEARCDVWDVDDREAKLLLGTLNRLEGQDQPLRRAQLLHELELEAAGFALEQHLVHRHLAPREGRLDPFGRLLHLAPVAAVEPRRVFPLLGPYPDVKPESLLRGQVRVPGVDQLVEGKRGLHVAGGPVAVSGSLELIGGERQPTVDRPDRDGLG